MREIELVHDILQLPDFRRKIFDERESRSCCFTLREAGKARQAQTGYSSFGLPPRLRTVSITSPVAAWTHWGSWPRTTRLVPNLPSFCPG